MTVPVATGVDDDVEDEVEVVVVGVPAAPVPVAAGVPAALGVPVVVPATTSSIDGVPETCTVVTTVLFVVSITEMEPPSSLATNARVPSALKTTSLGF